ncbi:MAG: TonB-dependent receptor [Nevskia sp.]|nr:TonB-dependent receptor [Nevskia sp.]
MMDTEHASPIAPGAASGTRPRLRRSSAVIGGSLLLATAQLQAQQNAPAPAPPADSTAQVDAAAVAPVASGDDNGGDSSSNAEQLGKILVHARKRAELLENVPLSISAVDGQTQATQHLDKLQDFQQKLPNFQPNTSNPRTSSLSIRGAGGVIGGSDGSESGVGLIVDDVFYTHVGFAWGGLFDVQDLEVARGPQGTLLGKNTTVGAVLVNTYQPSFKAENSAEVDAGNYGSVVVKAHSTGALIDDKLAYRLSYYSDHDDGWVPNPAYSQVNTRIADNYRDSIRLLNANRWALRFQLLWKPTDSIKSRLIAEHFDSAEYNNYSGTVAPTITQYANGAAFNSYYNKIANLFGVTSPAFNPYVGTATNPSPLKSYTDGLSDELTWGLGDYTLTSVTAWRRFQLWPRNTQGYYGLYINSTGYDVVAQQLSEEIRLASALGSAFDYQVGVYALAENLDSNYRYLFGQNAAAFFDNSASANPAQFNGLEYDQYGRGKTKSLAPFGQGTWHISDALDLTAGLRFTHEAREGSDHSFSFGGASNLSASDLAAQNKQILSYGGYFNLSGTAGNNSVAWLINPSYKVNDNTLLYALVARGEKSGAINTGAAPIYVSGVIAGNQPVITEPEVSRDFELGLKNSFLDKRLTLNVDLYWDNIHQYQGSITDTTSYHNADGSVAPKTYLSNIGEVRLSGIELDSAWAIAQGLNVYLNGALTGAKYVHYDNAGSPTEYQYSGGPAVLGLSGNSIASIPPWSANFGLDYARAAGQFQSRPIEAFGYLNESGTGRTRYSNPYQPTYFGQPAYALTNAGFGIRRRDGSASLSFYGKNIFDKKFITAESNVTATAPQSVSLGAPRTYGFAFQLTF